MVNFMGRMNRKNTVIIDDNAEIKDENTVTEFDQLTETTLNRRGFLRASVGFGASAFVMGISSSLPMSALASISHKLSFEAVPANSFDTVTVPKGYSWHVVASWGDPLWSTGVNFDQVTRGTGASQELAFGDNNDGMALFTEEGKYILAVNNEYVNRDVFHGNRESNAPENADDVRKSKAGHGLTIMQIIQKSGRWSIVKDSPYNRRITVDTLMEITGPARGDDRLKTAADPTATQSKGTWNNCGNGRTPWGTYLACEENFNGYFSSSDEAYVISKAFKRYGITHKDRGYKWSMADDRFDISQHPNEANRVGYIVEVDPLNPTSTPKTRTALGRFKHENAELVIADNGYIVVYMGDDERGEFLYKFVSDKKYDKYASQIEHSAILESGQLYAAKFYDNGVGEWLALTPEATGMDSLADICIHTRIAASAVKATTMDRPEWVAANPYKKEIYCALTNNKSRGKKTNAGGDEMPVGGPNPRADNHYGQIVRWMPVNGDHTSNTFRWDLFVVAGNPTVHRDVYAGSDNIDALTMFNSPDGLAFDKRGVLWVQTDGNYSNDNDFANQGNNQMLAADPDTGELRRFLVGPNECEITGSAWSVDGKTLFVGVQHPGENGHSHFPDGGDSIPRSSIIAITKDDGGYIG
jgi:secreted PhoX family phosphatase